MRVRTCKQLTMRDYGSHSRVAVCAVPSAHQTTQLVGGDAEASPRGEEQEGGGHSRGVRGAEEEPHANPQDGMPQMPTLKYFHSIAGATPQDA